LRNARWGTKFPNDLPLKDSLWETLTDSFCKMPMANTAEKLAAQFGITRAQCDEFALRSQVPTFPLFFSVTVPHVCRPSGWLGCRSKSWYFRARNRSRHRQGQKGPPHLLQRIRTGSSSPCCCSSSSSSSYSSSSRAPRFSLSMSTHAQTPRSKVLAPKRIHLQ
jgi:hypothetical protein